MLLAGGEGKRLGSLTYNLAKPAVPFGGKYRIIDFTLSNCTNSGIDTVGVLTQYQPLLLNSHIGNGSPWDLNRKGGGVFILPPFVEKNGGTWYKGTANAIFQNLTFLEHFNPKYVLVISGDHIYTMNYEKMLEFHQENKSDVTIAAIEVPWKEASRFGILNTDSKHQIIEFEEKPIEPKNNLASMGIYIFNYELLKEYLILDEANPKSSKDFGKDVLPKMLMDGLRLNAYPFDGYWKDVGTIESLWEANMDMLEETPPINLNDHQWRIRSVANNHLPQFISKTARIKNSIINEGCYITGEIEHSVLFSGVNVGNNSYIKDSVIMPNAQIGENVVIHKAIIGENIIIEDGSFISGLHDEVTIINEKSLKYKSIIPDRKARAGVER